MVFDSIMLSRIALSVTSEDGVLRKVQHLTALNAPP